MSEYERLREENLARNRAVLVELRLLNENKKPPTPPTKSKKKVVKNPGEYEEEDVKEEIRTSKRLQSSTRRSARLSKKIKAEFKDMAPESGGDETDEEYNVEEQDNLISYRKLDKNKQPIYDGK